MTEVQERPTRNQSICKWTFNAGAGGFVPADSRPQFKDLTPVQFGEIVHELIAPRVPANTRLGAAVHYDLEVNEGNAEAFANQLNQSGLAVSMATPGGHYHWANGGIASLNPAERKAANDFAIRAADLALGPLSLAEDPNCPMAIDVWNGSFGYRYATSAVKKMIAHADEGMAGLLAHVNAHPNGRNKKVGIEPKGFEKHPAMIYQTSDSVLAQRERLRAMGLDVSRYGLINEFGHSGMQGLEIVQEYAAASMSGQIDRRFNALIARLAELDPEFTNPVLAREIADDIVGAIVHVHANSQGGDDGRLGGPGKHDLDYGVKPTPTTLAIGKLLVPGYRGWIEHDMQPCPPDSEREAVNRVVSSVCRWEAICRTIEDGAYDEGLIEDLIANGRETDLEHYLDGAVGYANQAAKQLYNSKLEIPLSRVSFLRDI